MKFLHQLQSRMMTSRSTCTPALVARSNRALSTGACLSLSLALGLSSWSIPARAQGASDGCVVLLCLAGNWRNISTCVPPVRRALRDLMLGRSFPLCAFASPSFDAGAGTFEFTAQPEASASGTSASAVPRATQQATLRWASGDFCPVQYRTAFELEAGVAYACDFTGTIEVTIGGQLWNRTWWNMAGDSVTEWSPAARASLPTSSIDDRFERDFQVWQQRQLEATTATPGPEPGAGA